MSSRNTFTTNFIYSPDVLKAVEESLREVGVNDFTSLPHAVTGILRETSGFPYDDYKRLLEILDVKLAALPDTLHKRVEIVVAGDDDDDILCRAAPYGLVLYER